MRTVYRTAEEVLHIWAQQGEQRHARMANCYFEGTVAYSYGRHYPLGAFVTNKKGEQAVLINASGYSVTTSKHIGAARYATNHYKQFNIDSNGVMQDLVTAFAIRPDYESAARVLSSYVESIASGLAQRMASDTKRRKPATLAKWQSEAATHAGAMVELMEWLGVKPSAAAKKAMKALGGDADTLKAQAVKAQAAAKRKLAKAQKERERKNAALLAVAVPAWLAGESTVTLEGQNYSTGQAVQIMQEVLMRVVGERIETSKGASFPVVHGLRAFDVIRRVKASGNEWTSPPESRLELGHYKVDRIAPNGDVTAGCHFVRFAQIERVAKELGAA